MTTIVEPQPDCISYDDGHCTLYCEKCPAKNCKAYFSRDRLNED